jgi:hypothetical protein
MAMLETIQEMKFFLRTAFNDSKEFAGSTIEVKTQGWGKEMEHLWRDGASSVS